MKRFGVLVLFALFCAVGSASALTWTNFTFSVDIGGDMEFCDPNQDGDEVLDPGDIYYRGQPPNRLKDDFMIFGFDPRPSSTIDRVDIMWIYDDFLVTNFFDLDGEDQLGEEIMIFDPDPLGYPHDPDPTNGFLLNPAMLYYSLDDDDAPGWYAAPAMGFPLGDVPVNSFPDAGPLKDEIVSGKGWYAWPPVPGNAVSDEATLGMAPDPAASQADDDDVDALDNQELRYWYWSVDHEATMGLNPATIYITDLFVGSPNRAVAIPQYILGLGMTPGPDVDGFEFCVTDDPLVLEAFGLAPGRYLGVLFSVDENDPITQADESGGLNPNTIYISMLTGALPFPLSTREDDVDAITVGEEEEQPHQDLDFGDAPDSPVAAAYPTLLVNNGARHTIVGGVQMGALIDAEIDGQPNAAATGDDNNGSADEDGVVFTTPLQPGNPANMDVVVSVGGYISAWIDYSANKSWADAGEQIFNLAAVTAGVNHLNFVVPGTATVTTQTYARIRFRTANAAMSYNGAVSDGEVEDYRVKIQEEEPEPTMDFGDANDPTYPTLLANNGARHLVVPGVFLGKTVDTEANGQPDGTATGDDNNPPASLDDEDGLKLPGYFLKGQTYWIPVEASTNGFIMGWIDFSMDGDWNDAFELVMNSVPLVPGTNFVQVIVPAVYGAGGPDARFRFTTNQLPALSYTGFVNNGEVEDYEVIVSDADFGDAPAPYLTVFASNGARHVTGGPLFLGTNVDSEVDGQPDPNALGDDNAGDDENGVTPSG
ncbi:MAG: hypothetical protein KJ626_13325, partial [Verrucomicrobia bacterium]|nr:hypothetical protein [Verrucomicrobiota bacterium]